MQKKYVIAATLLFYFSILNSQFSIAQVPPIPARIGGTLTVNNILIKKGADAGYEIVITRQDGTAFTPAAEDRNGLSDSDWYQADIPIYNETTQPGGAEPGDKAVIHVFKDGSEISVTAPVSGIMTVGTGGTVARIDIAAASSTANQPPTADAGADMTVKTGETVTLDGSASSDPDDGIIVSYQWRQIGGTAVTLSDPAGAQPQFAAPAAGGILIFELTVKDKGGLSDTDQVTVTVISENQPPRADAGPDQSVKQGQTVTLDASGSADPDDGIAGYLWRQIGGLGVTLSDAGIAKPKFTAPDAGPSGESLIFKLTVTDRGGMTAADQVTINVTSENQPPVADAGDNQNVKAGVTVTLDASESADADDGIVSYQWRQISGTAVTLSGSSAIKAGFTAPDVGSGGESLVFELTVKDRGGLTANARVTINIISENLPPAADAGKDRSVGEGETVTLDGSASDDADDGIVSYQWRQIGGIGVTLSDAAAVQPKFTAPNAGSGGESLIFRLTVTDRSGLTDTDDVTVNITHRNQPPVADAGADQNVKSGVSVTLDASQSADPDGQIVSYAWRQTGGTRVTLSDTAQIKPKFTAPDAASAGESLIFELTVKDNFGLADTDSVTVNVVSENQPPVADAGADQTVNAGSTVILDGSHSSDPDDGIASYLWRQTDGTVVRLSDTTQIKPKFTAPDKGNELLTFELTVTDKGKLARSDSVTIHILSQNQPPFASAGPDQSVKQGDSVRLDGSNSADPDGRIVSYLWRQTGGTVVRLSDVTAVTPTFTASAVRDESLTFELTVTDDRGLADIASVRVNVIFSNLPPVAEAGPDQTVKEKTVIILDGSNSADPDGQIVSYFWKQISGAAVSLSDPKGKQTLFTASDGELPGQALTFELTVTDNRGLTAADRVTVNVSSENRAPVADAGPDQTVNEGGQVILDGSNSSDPDGQIVSYLWRQTGGRIMAISDVTGALSEFTASNGDLRGESLVFELTVTDNSGLAHTDRMTVNISAGNIPPSASAGPDHNVREGSVVTLNGSNSSDPDDGIAGYQWRQISGDSVTLSDPAAVQPVFTAPEVTASGKSLTFELTVSDKGGLQGTDTVTVNITNINQPPSADAGPVQTVKEGERVRLYGSDSSDPDGDIAGYLWTQTSGAGVTLSDPTDPEPEFTAPNFDLNSGALTFRLTVSDNGGLRDTDRVAINITFTNLTPSADAGADQTVREGTTVLLEALKSYDPDGSIVSYQWRQSSGAGVTLSAATEARVNFVTPPTDSRGATLIFELTVTDNGGLKDTDEISLRIYDNGITAFSDDVISFFSATDKEMGIRSSAGNITALYVRDAAKIADTADKPRELPYGLSDLEIKTDKTGGSAVIFVYLPAPAPPTHKWYRYTRSGAWYDYSANSSFSTDRKRVTLSFDDGGLGDNDGMADRKIICVTGLGYAKIKEDTKPSPEPSSESGGGDSNCFISTAAK
ncbi:MAG: hypothetical protein BWK80_03005 [Desulfobacteraceae bacterium IS3]|nr:MAG: hypothetical protein BWK80_03005 [Desulfobacteraceae bacterium IS3]